MNVRAISILVKSGSSTMLGIRVIFLILFTIRVFNLEGITQVVEKTSSAAEQQASNVYLPFDGNKTTWHGFDRYDFIMDDATGAITPMTAPESEVTSFGIDVSLKDGKRRCVVVVPKKAAPGYPWSWRGCYWNHQPQTEIELLNRGFHIAYVAPDPGRQGKAWDTWYKFLTEKHGLAKKAAFIGMSKGGVNEFNWGVVNPDKVACIYADNPALYEEDFARIPDLARYDIPILEIGGTEDGLLRPNALDIEDIYHKAGGLITVIIKEGQAHHPHSLQDPKPIADWIEQHMTPSTANRPAFVDATYAKKYYYSIEPSYIYFKEEATYATARGPGFTECYDRYDLKTPGTFRLDGISIIVPKTVAQGKPWLFTGDPIERNSTVEQALLAKGYHIVIVPMEQKRWDNTYKLLVDNGFSGKPAMKGTGPKAGEAYAWAIANPDKVSCIYARNPLMRSLMAKSPPIDNLAPLAKAGVPILHDCGSLDPWLNDQTRVVEKRYKELGGKIMVIIREGEGHFPLSPKNPKQVVDFIIEKASAVATEPSPRGAPGPIPSARPDEKQSYTVITSNGVGLGSMTSQWQYTFEPQDYGKVLDNVADVAVDSKNNIYALVRGPIPVLVFNAKGRYLRGWGQGLIGGTQGIYIDSLDNVFCVDSKDNVVLKFTTGGKLLMTLGTRGVASNSGSVKGNFKTVKTGAGPFNVPTKVATSKSGEIFVTDGYGNARVHRFSASGKLIKSWGEPGTGQGQFNLPHGIAVDNNNDVYVADRENDRIQIFDVDGNLKKIWNNIYRPSAICFHNGYIYVTELGHRMYVDNVLFIPDGKGPWSRVRIFDTNGVEQAKFGEPEGWKAGNFFSPHGICVDKPGNIYVAEVIWPANESKPPKDLHPGLQKFRRQ